MDDLLDEKFYVADTGNDRVVLYQLTRDDPTPPWTNLTAKVAGGDVLARFPACPSPRLNNYRQAFLDIGTNDLASAINQIGTLSPVYILDDKSEFDFTNTIDGQIITFPVKLLKRTAYGRFWNFEHDSCHLHMKD